MSMFDWQADPASSASSTSPDLRTVSRSFWIYWAVSIPLTIAIGLGWRLWWQFEQRKYDQQVTAAMEGLRSGD